VLNLTGMEVSVPEDYSGDIYKLLEDGNGGFTWQRA
jgi:hypothetical protein